MEESKISEFDFLFEKEKTKKKGKTHFTKKLIKKDLKEIIIASFFFIIKNSPVWIVPIITADVVNLISEKPENLWTRIMIDAILAFVIVTQNIFTHVINAKYSDRLVRKTSNGIRLSVIRKLQHLSITYHKEMESGAIQSKFLSDIDKIDAYYSTIIKVLIPGIIGVVVTVGICLFKSWLVTLFFLLVVPINLLSAKLFRKKMYQSNKDLRIESEQMASRITNMLQMMTLIKSHGLETVETLEAKKTIDKVTNAGLKVDSDIAHFGSMSWVVSTLLSLVSFFFTVYLAIKGIITVGDVVLFQSMFGQINFSVSSLINSFPTLMSGKESIESISEIISNEELESADGRKEPKNVIGYVDFNNVSYHYPDSKEYQIKDFDLHVRKGECIAFVGSSGSGKTTVMNLLLGLIDPQEGTVDIDGVPLTDLSKITYRHFVSVVPQNCILFPGSIKDNITYGLEHYTDEDLDNAIKASNIEEFLPQLKYGINTLVGEHGDKLSGGQRQRVSIARALIRKPKILILDEATSALDNQSEYKIEEAIDRLTKTCTTFIVAHRLSTIRNADRIVVMEEGKMVEIGSYKELVEKKGRFYELDKLSRIGNDN